MTQPAQKAYIAALFALLVSACGGGGGDGAAPPPTNPTFDLQAGVAKMATNGLSANVTLSGTVILNGVSTSFTGAGTFTRQPGVSATFNGTAAISQDTKIAGTITAAGQPAPFTASVKDYYAGTDSAVLGEVFSGEYDAAQAPLVFPTMVVGGSSGTLGTLSRYTDSTMGVPLGTAQLSYSVMAPVDPGSPIGIAVTTKIYDTTNTLSETDVTNYTMTSSNVISFASASTQSQSGTLTVTAQ